MEKLNYDLAKEYSHELSEIKNVLRQLESGRVYEISNATMDGYLANNIKKLEGKIADLLDKIQNGKDGDATRFAKMIK